MTQEERNPFKTRKQVEVSKDDYEWFKKTHGEEAKFSWIMNLLFNAYRVQYEKLKEFPLEVVYKAADNVIEENV